MPSVELFDTDALGLRAENPSAFTLEGTNSWLVGRDPAVLIDPGPALDGHVQALVAHARARGGLGAIVLTHDHIDHSEAVPALRAAFPQARLAAGRGDVDVRLEAGTRIGPLQAIFTPGHAPDHHAFAAGDVIFTGDAVLGWGSVFIAPDPGALTGYLQGLERLRARAPRLLAPGHGPVVTDPAARIAEYVAHRMDRERRLIEALAAGARTVDAMLDAAWPEVPEPLRPAAAVTLAAHLDKLADEGRLPAGVQRPEPIALRAP
ncbi:MAG TPA: MBL fold metallo-hydrolase [Solirubrobacteraceae bacterium]|nr:MBL fold metallo-hydrolase [Solirubrobacteraceae bacterium]